MERTCRDHQGCDRVYRGRYVEVHVHGGDGCLAEDDAEHDPSAYHRAIVAELRFVGLVLAAALERPRRGLLPYEGQES